MDDDQDPLLPRQESRDAELLNIVERIELGEMSKMYFNKIGRFLFYLVIVVYLFGDLAIYAATVPKSMVSILCNNLTCVENMSLPTSNLSAPCTPGFESEFLKKHSRRDIYHLGKIKISVKGCLHNVILRLNFNGKRDYKMKHFAC